MLEEALGHLVRGIVDHPEDVDVRMRTNRRGRSLDVRVHPDDMGRVIGVMHKLRDAGNSLVVVEHEPQVMLAADRILDMGPGPGERGGEDRKSTRLNSSH